MVQQKELTLNFENIVNNNKILIINLANIGEERTSSLGTLLLNIKD